MLKHFDLLASIYDRIMGPPDLARWRHLLKLPTDGWVLDAGGGTGRISHPLRGLVGRLVVCDLSMPMLKHAKAKGRLFTVQCHTEQLPFPGEVFDRVLVVDALHHFCDGMQSMGELLRVLRKGGRMVIQEPDINRLSVKAVALAERVFLMRSRFHSPSEIRAMVEAFGFTSRIETRDLFSAWIVVEKPIYL